MSQKTLLKQVLFGRIQRYIWLCLFLVAFSSLGTFFNNPPKVEAATSGTMNFQARLLQSSGALVPDGYYNAQFKLYSASSGGSALWTETYYDSNGVTAGNDNRVRVANGYLTVNLGALSGFPGSINWDQEHWLTMNIGGTTHTDTPTWDGEMTPRLKLTAVPYAFTAGKLQQTDGGNTSTLGFATQTSSRSILLPDESGTVCLRASANCGFATGSDADYLQNGSSPQTADFNITGNGTVGSTLNVNGDLNANGGFNLTDGGDEDVNAVRLFDNAGSIYLQHGLGGAIVLRDETAGVIAAFTSDGLEVSSGGIVLSNGLNTPEGGITINGVNLYAPESGLLLTDGVFRAGNNIYAQEGKTNQINLGGVAGGSGIVFGINGDTNLYRSGADTLKTDDTFDAAAYSVGGTAGLSAACSSGAVLQDQVVVGGIVTGGTCVAGGASSLQGAYDGGNTILTSDANDISFTLANTATDSNFIINVEDGSTGKFAIQNDGTDTFSIGATGNVLSKATENSTNAFEVQNADGESLLNIDTANNVITLGGNNSGELQQWDETTQLLNPRWFSTSVVANGYMYVIGGAQASGDPRDTVYYTKLNSDGGVGSWVTSSVTLPTNLQAHSTVVVNGYLYIIGGNNGSATTATYYTKLNSDGSISAWKSTTTPFATGTFWHKSVTANGYIYVIGGYTGSATDDAVAYAKVNSDGSLGSWSPATDLDTPLHSFSTVVANGYIYVIGGYTGAAYSDAVYYAKLNSNGSLGSWTESSNPLNPAVSLHQSVVMNGYVYVIGGYDGVNLRSEVYYAQLNKDGSTGPWQTAVNSLPEVRNQASVASYNGYVYLIGGRGPASATTPVNTVYYTSGQRLLVGGSLDLVGLSDSNMSDGGDGGSLGGSLTAGNTNIIGSLQVRGDTSLAQGLNVGGNTNVGGSLQVTGQVQFQNSTDSGNAFQVQNSNGLVLTNSDTDNFFNIDNGVRSVSGNMLQNPSFESAAPLDAAGSNGWIQSGSASITSSVVRTGTQALSIPTATIAQDVNAATLYEVVPGDYMYAEGWVRTSSGANGTGGLLATFYDGNGDILTYGSEIGSSPGTGWTLFQAEEQVPVGAKYMTIGATVRNTTSPTGTWYFDDLYMMRENEQGYKIFRNSIDETYVFQIQNSAGDTLFNADTENMRIGIGTDTPQAELHVMGPGTNGAGARIAIGDYCHEDDESCTDSDTNIFVGEYGDGDDSDVLQLQGKGGLKVTTGEEAEHVNFEIDNNGSAFFQATVNAPAAFMVADTDNTQYLRVNSEDRDVHVGNGMLNIDIDNAYVINNGAQSVANEIQNSSFESQIISLDTESGYQGNDVYSSIAPLATARTGNNVLQITNPAGQSPGVGVTKTFDVTEGEQLYFRGWVKATSGTNGEAGYYLACYNKAWGSPSYTNAWSTATTAWTTRTATVNVPAGCAHLTVSITVRSNSTTGTWYFDDLYLTRSGFEAPTLFKNVTDSTNALQIQNAAGLSLFNADTSNMQVDINGWITMKGANNPATPTLTRTTSGGSLTNPRTYYYRLSAIAANGEETSAIASSPASFATTNNSNRMTLSWSPVTGATGYKIYRSINAGSTWQVNTVASGITSINDNGSNFTWSTTEGLPWWNYTAGIELGDDKLLALSTTNEVFLGYSSQSDVLAITNMADDGSITLQADNYEYVDTDGNEYFAIQNGGAATFQNSTNSTTGFQIQRSVSSGGGNVLTADTTNTRVLIGSATSPTLSSAQLVVTVAEVQTTLRVGNVTNGVSFNDTATGASGKLRLYGTARNTKKITLSPEYAGAVLDGDGVGSMTAGFDWGEYEGYYKWTSTQGTMQCYDIIVKAAVPSDWDGWASNAFSVNTWSSESGPNTYGVIYVGGDVLPGTADVDAEEITGDDEAWYTHTFNLTSNEYVADGYVLIDARLCAQNGASTQIGTITLSYLSKF